MIRRKENNFKKFQELKVKTTKLPKVQEKHVFYIWLVERVVQVFWTNHRAK